IKKLKNIIIATLLVSAVASNAKFFRMGNLVKVTIVGGGMWGLASYCDEQIRKEANKGTPRRSDAFKAEPRISTDIKLPVQRDTKPVKKSPFETILAWHTQQIAAGLARGEKNPTSIADKCARRVIGCGG